MYDKKMKTEKEGTRFSVFPIFLSQQPSCLPFTSIGESVIL